LLSVNLNYFDIDFKLFELSYLCKKIVRVNYKRVDKEVPL